jgi:hypothetical protein
MSVCSYWKKKPQHCTTFAAKKKAPMVLLLLMAPAADEGQKTFPHKRRKKFFVFPINEKIYIFITYSRAEDFEKHKVCNECAKLIRRSVEKQL